VFVEAIVGVVVLALLIYRQLRTRLVNASALRINVILVVVGLVETFQFLQKNHVDAAIYAAIGGSLVLAAVFGALRAKTVRLWLQDGQAWSKGNWLTASLWIIAFAAHLGYDGIVAHAHGASGVGPATVVLYISVNLGVQRVIVQQRAHHLQPIRPAAFDSFIIGVAPDFTVYVRRDVLDETDDPILRYGLQQLQGSRLFLPLSDDLWPNREALKWRFERFRVSA
jgi:hypothetical protein